MRRAHNAFCAAILSLCVITFVLGDALAQVYAQYEGHSWSDSGLSSADSSDVAIESGRTRFEAIRASDGDSPTVASIEAKLAAIEDSKALAVHKLAMIAESLRTGTASPFLYVAPTARELLDRTRRQFLSTRPVLSGLTDQDAKSMDSFLSAAALSADREVIDAYLVVLSAGSGQEAVSKARAYLSAYVVGSHDSRTYPEVLSVVGEEIAEGGVPLFLADDALDQLGDVQAARDVLGALDSVTWARRSESQWMGIWRKMAALCEDGGENDWAIAAHGRIVAEGSGEDARNAQRAIIRIWAEKAGDYRSAALACAKYAEMFPESPDLDRTRYLKASYEYMAKDYGAALKEIETLKQADGDSRLLSHVLLLEGLVFTAEGKQEKAVEAFSVVLQEYPQGRLAGKAQFLVGVAYLSQRKYAEARECFQRVVDFYPNDSHVTEAKRYLESIKNL